MTNSISNSSRAQRLAQDLRTARITSNLTQSEVGTRAGLHQAQVARAEAGADLRLSTLLELAHALGLELFLVPAPAAPAVAALTRSPSQQTVEERPLYALDDDEEQRG